VTLILPAITEASSIKASHRFSTDVVFPLLPRPLSLNETSIFNDTEDHSR
jgi:hypothetical protein